MSSQIRNYEIIQIKFPMHVIKIFITCQGKHVMHYYLFYKKVTKWRLINKICVELQNDLVPKKHFL